MMINYKNINVFFSKKINKSLRSQIRKVEEERTNFKSYLFSLEIQAISCEMHLTWDRQIIAFYCMENQGSETSSSEGISLLSH